MCNRLLQTWSMCLVFLPLVALSACAHQTPSSIDATNWSFQWNATIATQATAAQAFTAAGMAIDPQGNPHAPARVTWLVETATLGLAVTQLDPHDQVLGFIYLQKQAHTWNEVNEMLLARPGAATGSTAPQPLAFPTAPYVGQMRMQTYAPIFTMHLWLAPTYTFAFGYLAASMTAPPTSGAQSISIGQHAGWLQTDGMLATVVVPLGAHVVVLCGNVAAATIEHLTTQALANLTVLTTMPG